MKNLEKLLKEVLEDFDSLDIEYGKIVDIKVNTRAKSRWGQCQRRYDGYHININVELLSDTLEDTGAKDTIAHEVCHTIKGCMNHGSEWKKYAHLLNTIYGYNIKRVDSAADKGIDPAVHESIQKQKSKYMIRCNCCGTEYFYTKKTKIVNTIANQKYHTCRCGKCKSHNLMVIEL